MLHHLWWMMACRIDVSICVTMLYASHSEVVKLVVKRPDPTGVCDSWWTEGILQHDGGLLPNGRRGRRARPGPHRRSRRFRIALPGVRGPGVHPRAPDLSDLRGRR